MSLEVRMAQNVACLAVCLALGMVFVGAGLSKLLHWSEFRSVVRNYRLVPPAWATLIAAVLPPLEVLAGAALICRFGLPWSAATAAAFLLVFALAMAINLRRGRKEIDCGCFQSSLRQTLDWRLVIRNLGCAVALLACVTVPPLSTSAIWLNAIPAGLLLYLLYVALNAVWALDASRIRMLNRI